MTEATFLKWLRKAAKRWKPFIRLKGEISEIRLLVSGIGLCPLESVELLRDPLKKPADAWYINAARDMKLPTSIAYAADKILGSLSKSLQQKRIGLLKACGLNKQLAREQKACSKK